MDVIKRKDRVSIRVRDEKGNYLKSVIIPTEMYPLNDKYEYFDKDNTKEVTDENILNIIDTIPYKIGQCYDNTLEIYEKLTKAGYDIQTYAGWLYIVNAGFPVHHCWAVINGNQLIDMGDNNDMLYDEKAYIEKRDKYETMSDYLYARFVELYKMKNSVRCKPIGLVPNSFVYIGSKCEPTEAKRLYTNLLNKYPNHETYTNVNKKTNMNKTQNKLKSLLNQQ